MHPFVERFRAYRESLIWYRFVQRYRLRQARRAYLKRIATMVLTIVVARLLLP